MNEIKILSDRIIIDGHADTREQCETATMLANLLLAQGSGFNCVEYRSGYAEFKKSDVVKLADSELKFIATASLDVYSNDGSQTLYYSLDNPSSFNITVTSTGFTNDAGSDYTYSGTGTFRGLATSPNQTTPTYGIGATVTIPVQPAITGLYVVDVPEPTPTLTFKHFFDAGLQGTGTYKFRHYSQQEPSTGETWVFNTPVTYKMFGSTATYSVQFTCDGERYSTINVHYPAKGDDGQLQYNEVNVVDTAGGWINDKYRTIVLDEPATGDLLTMLQKAAVKQ